MKNQLQVVDILAGKNRDEQIAEVGPKLILLLSTTGPTGRVKQAVRQAMATVGEDLTRSNSIAAAIRAIWLAHPMSTKRSLLTPLMSCL